MVFHKLNFINFTCWQKLPEIYDCLGYCIFNWTISYISSHHPQISGLRPDLFSQEHLFNLLRPSSLYHTQNKDLRGQMLAHLWDFTPCCLGQKAIWKLSTIQQRSETYKLGLQNSILIWIGLLMASSLLKTNSMAKHHMICPFRILVN